MLALAFWLLLAPGDDWTWVIVGGHDSRDGCEDARSRRLDTEYVICAAAEQPAMYSNSDPETDNRWWSHISRAPGASQ